MMFTLPLIALPLTVSAAAVSKRAASYSVTSGTPVTIQDPAPVGISLEFFAFPGYVQDVSATQQCIANLDSAQGAPTRIRIGGTTQDRATYDPTLTSAVSYTVPSAGAAPNALTYGPSFFDLASKLSGPTTIGINRRLANLTNGIAAAKQAVNKMSNLYAFELGNEPEFYGNSAPIANGQSWTPSADASSQTSWQKSFGQALGKTEFVQGGVFLQPPTWSVQELEPVEVSSGSAQYLRSFSDHSYPQSACGGASTNLQTLMNHSTIVSYTRGFTQEVAAAAKLGKPLFFGETNSATCGGGGISPTFGAALWIVDYVMQAVLVGYQRLYFHQGTIGNCQYCWWGRYDMGAPYYGAYFAASAFNGMTSISQLDDGTSPVAVYILSSGNTPTRAVIYNSAYYSSGSRPYTGVTLTGLTGSSVTAKRLTAPYATSRVDQGGNPTFAGQTFANGTCNIQGPQRIETVAVNGGSATFNVGASEALLVQLA